MKIKWHVAEAPSGPFRSFQHRCWPHGEIKNDLNMSQWAVRIEAYIDGKPIDPFDAGARMSTSYTPTRAKMKNLSEDMTKGLSLKVFIRDFRDPKGQWRGLTKLCNSLVEAKAAAVKAYEQHPEFLPK